MPTFYNFTENGVVYNFDDVFVPSDLFRDGNLWTWGPGNNGELGNNNTTTRSTPVTTSAGGANWKQVSMGTFHTAAIKTDGTLWTWGYGGNGQLGNAAITNRSTPVTTFAGGTNWKQVSGGDQHTAAIKTDGTLWTWGYCSNGRLGNAVITTGRSTPVTTFAGGTNWKQVSCGYTFMQAIKTDGTLWVWGSNAFGQLGNNNSSGVLTPVTTFAGGTNWKSSNGGYGHTIAIKTDGTLWTWGRNNLGQLGNNSTTNCSTPVTTFAGGNNWKSTGSIRGFFFPVLPSTDGNISAAIKTDGTLWTWGQGSYGSLGNNTTTTRSTPVTTFAGGTNWKQVSCGSMNMAALTYDDPVI
jgi:alpha-tubulin suppressor-like RCC1 family protein